MLFKTSYLKIIKNLKNDEENAENLKKRIGEQFQKSVET